MRERQDRELEQGVTEENERKRERGREGGQRERGNQEVASGCLSLMVVLWDGRRPWEFFFLSFSLSVSFFPPVNLVQSRHPWGQDLSLITLSLASHALPPSSPSRLSLALCYLIGDEL